MNSCKWMKSFVFGVALLGSLQTAQAQTVPSGPRLKDIPNRTLIGTQINGVVGGSSNDQTLTDREFNCGQALWYAGYGGQNAINTYDFTNLNNSINWLLSHGKSKDANFHGAIVPCGIYETASSVVNPITA